MTRASRAGRTPYLLRLRRDLAGRRDRGAATVFVIGMALVLFGVAGLAIDGGKVINEKDKAFDVAEQAARAGANQIALGPLRSGGVVVIDSQAARSAAASFVSSTSTYQLDGSPAVNGNQVTVAVTKQISTNLLGLFGFGNFTIHAQATASPVTGIGAGGPP